MKKAYPVILLLSLALTWSLASCDENSEPNESTVGMTSTSDAATDSNPKTDPETAPETEPETAPDESKYSKGLSFSSHGDGTCTVSGIGSCTDADVVIPPVSPDGDKVTGIGQRAFFKHNGLTSIIIPDGVTSIGHVAFSSCTSLTSITIPDSVISIGDYAFSFCTGLTSITIPDSVINIRESAFYRCTGLTSITIPDSVTNIEDGAFHRCTGLTSITVDVNNPVYHSAGNCIIETASKTLIAGCQSSVIPSDGSVTSIGRSVFEECIGLTGITIPDSVTGIGHGAFFTCTGLTAITADANNPLYHSAGNCLIETASQTLILGCQTSVIPSDGSVVSIGDNAFYGCTSLTSITIPDSVTNIGDYAFFGCSGLTDITFTGTKAQWRAIIKHPNWDQNTGSYYTIHCTDGDLTK